MEANSSSAWETAKDVAYAIRTDSNLKDRLNLTSISNLYTVVTRTEPQNLLEAMRYLRDSLGFNFLSSISGVDYRKHLEAVYHLRSIPKPVVLQVNVRVDLEEPEIDSVTSLWPTANWHEREIYDLMGIVFTGHPNLTRIFFHEEGYVGHPQRKNYKLISSLEDWQLMGGR